MPDSPDNADLIQARLEQWDQPEARADTNRWLADDPRARPLLAEQRAIHLAMQARAGNDARHRLVRDRVLASVKEETAPKAVRDAIVARVNVEAERHRQRLFFRKLRGAFMRMFPARTKSWAAAFAFLMVLLGFGWLLLQPKPADRSHYLARIENGSGEVRIRSGPSTSVCTNGQLLQYGQQLLVDSNGAASVELSNGARLQIGANTLIAFPGEPPAGASLFIERGLVAATLWSTNGGQPLVIQTPHLRATAQAGQINLDADAQRSRLHVIHGEGAASRDVGTTAVKVGAGQAVEAFRGEATSAALAARPYSRRVSDWPFKSDSPWNTPVGSGSLLARITAPQWPPAALSNTVIIRQIFFSEPTDPRRNFISPGEEPRQIRYPDWWQPTGRPGEIVCALFINDGLCCEMTEPVRLGSLDIRVRERNSTDLFGSGVGWSWPRPRTIGGSALAGVIRRGELTFGIPHAMALAVNPKYLNATRGTGGHVWPGVPIAPEVVAQFGREGNLAIGSLLVISPRTNILDLGFGASGPAYEIARALQDYGAYVIQITQAPLQIISAADAGLPPDIDAILARLVPHLRLVSNNSLRNVGGGGERSRPGAPPFSE